MRYMIWTDSESAIDIKLEKHYYINVDEAYNVLCDFVHKYDGESFRVIGHIEDLRTEETIETLENIIA